MANGDGSTSTRRRMAPDDRRAQLVEVASRILLRDGTDGLRIPEVAREAGVTRPVVYRFFTNRKALVVAVLDEFANALERQFAEPLTAQQGDLDSMVRSFVDASCAAIEECGPAAWLLLGGVAFDAEIREVVEEITLRLSEPWRNRVARVTRADQKTVDATTAMLVAASRAVLRLWIDGHIDRDQLGDALSRGVRALLAEFTANRDD